MRILIAVTHLLGAGHLTRAGALARAFAASGHETVLVSGGMPSPLVRLGAARLIQLPPVRSAGFDFGRLVGKDGAPAEAPLLAARRSALLDAFERAAPDVVVTELFPFGRRILADEFMALVSAARARPERPLILASVRDILVPPDRPSKVADAHARIAGLYDAVLVHGDPAFVPLDASWPVDPALATTLRYTGYVDEGDPVGPGRHREEVLVAAGSSSAGLGLFQAAIAAARQRPDLGWRLLVGHGIPERELARLAEGLSPGTVMRARPDYRALMARSAVSVSQCGYNTAVDLLATGTPAVLVPFEAGRETEQRLRAERLAALGLARIVGEADLSPDALIAAVLDATAPETAPTAGPFALDGSTRTVGIVEEMAAARRTRPRPDPFAGLRDAFDRAADSGRRVPFWWRDDDAVGATPALDRLLALASGAPLLIAAIPGHAEPSLRERLAEAPGVSVAIHGLTHADHAPPGDKASEFGPHRPLDVLCEEAARALSLARERLALPGLLPVFVPPWNRLSEDLARALPSLGYRGLSAAGGPAIDGLTRADAPWDVIDWRGTRSLRDRRGLLDTAIRHAETGSTVPLGLLTHHLAHDEAIWDFLEVLIPLLARHPAVELCDPAALFGPAVDARTGAPISPLHPCPRAV